MIYVILLLVSFLLTYFIKEFALRRSLVATVNERSSHSIPTPHGGGIAIALTWFAGIIYLYITTQIENQLFYALLIGVFISIVSFFDDLYELSAKTRLTVQGLSAFVALTLLGGLESLNFGLFSIQSPFIVNTFAFFMIIWFVNLYNFLDGINGYAGSEAVFLSFAAFLIFSDLHFIVLAVSVLGFLYWNWNKAKIFMGDVGSTLLGYNVAVFTIYYSNQDSSNLWIWIILFGLFWFDATLTLLRRKLNGEKLSQAHKKHAYQRLTQSGWAHDRVVIFSILVNALLFCLVYFISNISVAFFISLIMLYGVMKYVDSRLKHQ